jgi:integrase
MKRALSDVQVRGSKPRETQYKLVDGNGLYVLIHPNGSKYWRYRFRLRGSESVFAIGQYPQVSLQQAREARDDARRAVKSGMNPAHERKLVAKKANAQAANTFIRVSMEWIAQHQDDWSPYYLKQVQRAMRTDVYPAIGDLPLNAISAHQLLEIVQKVAERGAGTVATLIRQWCSAIFRYGVATLRCEVDPASAIKGAVRRRKVKHKQALPHDQLMRLARGLSDRDDSPVHAALRLLMLTFVRPGELRRATWNEFDLKSGEWRIPAERMKMRETHIVPLAKQTVDVLLRLKERNAPVQGYVFPNLRRPAEPMSPTTMNRALERMGWAGQFSAHGFRATASTVLNEGGYRADVIERQLAHRERNKVRASYNHASYMPERRKMMQEWADYLSKLSSP